MKKCFLRCSFLIRKYFTLFGKFNVLWPAVFSSTFNNFFFWFYIAGRLTNVQFYIYMDVCARSYAYPYIHIMFKRFILTVYTMWMWCVQSIFRIFIDFLVFHSVHLAHVTFLFKEKKVKKENSTSAADSDWLRHKAKSALYTNLDTKYDFRSK